MNKEPALARKMDAAHDAECESAAMAALREKKRDRRAGKTLINRGAYDRPLTSKRRQP